MSLGFFMEYLAEKAFTADEFIFVGSPVRSRVSYPDAAPEIQFFDLLACNSFYFGCQLEQNLDFRDIRLRVEYL